MLKLISFILIVFSLNTYAMDVSLGFGYAWNKDRYGDRDQSLDVGSLTIGHRDIKLMVQYVAEYDRSPWADTNPEFGNQAVPKHVLVSVVKTIYQYDYGEVNFYFDFGLSYVNKISDINSSRVLFHENLGVKYKRMSFYFSHSSNAGLVPPNTGEDLFTVEYSF